jgi:hypothetical protein
VCASDTFRFLLRIMLCDAALCARAVYMRQSLLGVMAECLAAAEREKTSAIAKPQHTHTTFNLFLLLNKHLSTYHVKTTRLGCFFADSCVRSALAESAAGSDFAKCQKQAE